MLAGTMSSVNVRLLGVLILTADSFRTSLQKQLESAAGRVLLRVICSREDHKPIDFTGSQLVASSMDIARRYCDAPSGSVVLLLPHAPELFLLHLGLILCGYSLTTDGWYATGDYGFTERNQIYVIGRIKDIIIVGGQNIYAEDVEAVANSVDGVYPGRVVAFGIDDPAEGTQNLVVVAEMRGEFDLDRARVIERGIHRLIASATGVAAHEVKVVSERWIVKSTARKISRRETRDRFVEDVFNARVHRGGRAES